MTGIAPISTHLPISPILHSGGQENLLAKISSKLSPAELSVRESAYIHANQGMGETSITNAIKASRQNKQLINILPEDLNNYVRSLLNEIPADNPNNRLGRVITIDEQMEALKKFGGIDTYENHLNASYELFDNLKNAREVVIDYYKNSVPKIDNPEGVTLVWKREHNHASFAGTSGPQTITEEHNLVDATLSNISSGRVLWPDRTVRGTDLSFDQVYDLLDKADIQGNFDTKVNKFQDIARAPSYNNSKGMLANFLETSLNIKAELAGGEALKLVKDTMDGVSGAKMFRPDVNGYFLENTVMFSRDNPTGNQPKYVMVSLEANGGVHEFKDRNEVNRWFGNPENETYILGHSSLHNRQNNVAIAPSSFGIESALNGFQHTYDQNTDITRYSIYKDNLGADWSWHPDSYLMELENDTSSKLNPQNFGDKLAESNISRIISDGDSSITSDSEYRTSMALKIAAGVAAAAGVMFGAAGAFVGPAAAAVMTKVGIAADVTATAIGLADGVWQTATGDTAADRSGGIASLVLETAGIAALGLSSAKNGIKSALGRTGSYDVTPPIRPNHRPSFINNVENVLTHGLSGDPIGAAKGLKRLNVIAQNSRQSGDTNGIAASLLSDPGNKLVFPTSLGDESGRKILNYYKNMGVGDQVVILNIRPEGSSSLPSDFTDFKNVITLEVKDTAKTSPNQVYQYLTASGSSSRETKSNFLANITNFDDVQRQLRALDVDGPSDIGQSTKLIADKINKGDPTATKEFFSKNWNAYQANPALSVEKKQAINIEVERVYTEIKNQLQSQNLDSVSLVWSRGLNDAEHESVSKLGQKFKKDNKKQPLSDDQIQQKITQDTLEGQGGKKNPHHLMTPQLFNTISAVNKEKNVLTIPIGDPIEFAPYANALQGNPRSYMDLSNPVNLTQYWKNSDALSTRFEQGVFLQQLFKKLNDDSIPLQQIGIRSGEMEKGAYLGIPTMYLEENLATSGARLQTVASGGTPAARANTEVLQKAKDLAPLRDRIDEMNNLLSKKEDILAKKKTFLPNLKPQAAERSNREIETLSREIEELKGQLRTARVQYNEKTEPLVEAQLDALLKSQTHWAATKGSQEGGGGLPYFMRENLENLVGLKAAKNSDDLNELQTWLDAKLAGATDAELPDIRESVLKGTMNPLEVDLLGGFIDSIKLGYPDYKLSYLPS